MTKNFFPTTADTETVMKHEDTNQILGPEARDIFQAQLQLDAHNRCRNTKSI